MKEKNIPNEFWDEARGRFDSHSYFKTINHHHICDYSDEQCDLMIVECNDGQWYIEDNWGHDARGASDVFNPFDRDSYPTFFPDIESANQRAAEIVSSITGCSLEELILED